MTKVKLIVLILFVLPFKVWCCQCIDTYDYDWYFNNEYENSDLIIIGNPVCLDNSGSYDIEILEILKGDWNNDIISGGYFTSCSLSPAPDEGLWLIYADFQSKDEIEIEECGLSRNLGTPEPWVIRGVRPPPPVYDSRFDIDERLNYLKLVNEYRIKALELLQKEIAELRKRRDN